MKKYTVFIYTNGMGGGHLARVNAIYKGFIRANINVRFCACVYKSRFKHILHPDIEIFEKNELPENIDIFISDWRTDEFINSLPQSIAKVWIALNRLTTDHFTFPAYYKKIAIEPGVEGDRLFYPIINTYPDELKTRNFLFNLIGEKEGGREIAIYGENGVTEHHVDTVFQYNLEVGNVIIIKSTNNPYSKRKHDINYYPLAELFSATDYLVIGAGYNSVHEALCYADLEKTKMLQVNEKDQPLRINQMNTWERKREPENHLFAQYMVSLIPTVEK